MGNHNRIKNVVTEERYNQLLFKNEFILAGRTHDEINEMCNYIYNQAPDLFEALAKDDKSLLLD